LLLEEDSCLSSIAIGELAFGIAKLDAGARKSSLQAQLAEWRVRFAERTFVYDAAAAMSHGDVLATARREGRPMSMPDAQVAAIAKNESLGLATRNTKDFEITGLHLINPWL
jgi:toxin FitB